MKDSSTTISTYVIRNLPVAALGLYVYLRSFPDGFKGNTSALMKDLGIGDCVYRKSMTILNACNLIYYKQERKDGGRYIGRTIMVDDGSDFMPLIGLNKKKEI
jgi:hypothetical protein